jgi:hypothetical protein
MGSAKDIAASRRLIDTGIPRTFKLVPFLGAVGALANGPRAEREAIIASSGSGDAAAKGKKVI